MSSTSKDASYLRFHLLSQKMRETSFLQGLKKWQLTSLMRPGVASMDQRKSWFHSSLVVTECQDGALGPLKFMWQNMDLTGRKYSKQICFVSIKIIQLPIHTLKKEVLPEDPIFVPNREKRSKLYDLFPTEFNSPELSDFKLVCQDETFLCHKFILGVGSPVFKGMFQSGAKEVTESEVRIEDVEKDLLKLMLEWMYGDDIGDKIQRGIQERMGLYKLADRYLVDPLKECLAVEILYSVTTESAFDVYKLGEACGDERFKTKAMELMESHKKIVFSNDEIFHECCKKFPELLQRIVTGGN